MLLGLRLFGYAEGGTIYQSMEDDRGDRGGVALAFIYVSLISIKVPLFFFFWGSIDFNPSCPKKASERERECHVGRNGGNSSVYSFNNK